MMYCSIILLLFVRFSFSTLHCVFNRLHAFTLHVFHSYEFFHVLCVMQIVIKIIFLHGLANS